MNGTSTLCQVIYCKCQLELCNHHSWMAHCWCYHTV